MGQSKSKLSKAEKKALEEKFIEKKQTTPFLTQLSKNIASQDPVKALETVKLLNTLYGSDYDRNCVFVGSVFYDRKVNHLDGTYSDFINQSYVLMYNDHHYQQSKSLYIDGVKPYLLAFRFCTFNRAWTPVFEILLHHSNFDVKNDKVFGESFYELILKYASYNNTGVYLSREIYRKIMRGVVFDKAERMVDYIKFDFSNMITDILNVCDCKELLTKRNFLFNIAREKGRTHLIPLFVNKGQDVFQKVDGKSCYVTALENGNANDYLYYLANYDILSRMDDYVLQWVYFSDVSKECFAETLAKGKEAKRDLIKAKSSDGTPLAFVCTKKRKNETWKVINDETEWHIRTLVLEGADIYEKVNDKRIVDILFEEGHAGLVNRMIAWSEEHIRKSAPPPPPPVVIISPGGPPA